MDPDERKRELRAREIRQLESRLKVDPPPGCFGFLFRYTGLVILLLIAGVVMAFNDMIGWALILYPCGIVGYCVYWFVTSILHDLRKSRLKKLLKEEKKDLRRSRGKRWWEF